MLVYSDVYRVYSDVYRLYSDVYMVYSVHYMMELEGILCKLYDGFRGYTVYTKI